MKFLIDAQLPRRLSRRIQETGHDAVHTLDLPAGNRTSDAEICALSLREQRVVITKDADFVNAFLLVAQPYKLLIISTGNINNTELETLVLSNMTRIVSALDTDSYAELTRAGLIIHG